LIGDLNQAIKVKSFQSFVWCLSHI